MITLIVVDGGPNARTGTATININVLDSNDNKPKFVGGPNFEVNVVENTPPGTVVLRLQAVDIDDGLNGQVEYSFAGSTLSSQAGQVFTIRNNTGEILVRVSPQNNMDVLSVGVDGSCTCLYVCVQLCFGQPEELSYSHSACCTLWNADVRMMYTATEYLRCNSINSV
jgi:Cadherin domain